MKTWSVPSAVAPLAICLAMIAGYVDTAGFLALHGLFTAHVTGNFVTAGAALVEGTSGLVAKLLALPAFCVVVAAVRVAGTALATRGADEVRWLLGVEAVLLAIGGALAIAFGPFADGDSATALETGTTLVAAMAVQNAVQRIHLGTLPPATLMTGNTTQLVIDLVDRVRGVPGVAQPAARQRVGRIASSVVAFAVGCATAAIAFVAVADACFGLPPLLAVAAVMAASGRARPP